MSGEVGAAMQGLGMPEQPLVSSEAPASDIRLADPLDAVLLAAEEAARDRGAPAIRTRDLLIGVRVAYGSALDHALAVRGTSFAEILERLD